VRDICVLSVRRTSFDELEKKKRSRIARVCVAIKAFKKKKKKKSSRPRCRFLAEIGRRSAKFAEFGQKKKCGIYKTVRFFFLLKWLQMLPRRVRSETATRTTRCESISCGKLFDYHFQRDHYDDGSTQELLPQINRCPHCSHENKMFLGTERRSGDVDVEKWIRNTKEYNAYTWCASCCM
jgi:hypothetical protein